MKQNKRKQHREKIQIFTKIKENINKIYLLQTSSPDIFIISIYIKKKIIIIIMSLYVYIIIIQQNIQRNDIKQNIYKKMIHKKWRLNDN